MEIINKELPTPPGQAPTQPPVAATSAVAKPNPLGEMFKNMSPMNRILIGFAGGMIILVVVLLIIVPKRPTQPRNNTPSPVLVSTASASLIPKQLSTFGQTEEFKKFEATLDDLMRDNDTLDLNEEKLAFPLLDMQVSFE